MRLPRQLGKRRQSGTARQPSLSAPCPSALSVTIGPEPGRKRSFGPGRKRRRQAAYSSLPGAPTQRRGTWPGGALLFASPTLAGSQQAEVRARLHVRQPHTCARVSCEEPAGSACRVSSVASGQRCRGLLSSIVISSQCTGCVVRCLSNGVWKETTWSDVSLRRRTSLTRDDRCTRRKRTRHSSLYDYSVVRW